MSFMKNPLPRWLIALLDFFGLSKKKEVKIEVDEKEEIEAIRKREEPLKKRVEEKLEETEKELNFLERIKNKDPKRKREIVKIVRVNFIWMEMNIRAFEGQGLDVERLKARCKSLKKRAVPYLAN